MDTFLPNTVIFVILAFILIVMIAVLIVMLAKLYIANDRCERLSEELNTLKESNSRMLSINYSERVLSFTHILIDQVATMKYKEFMSRNDISKTTRTHLKPLIGDVINTVYDGLHQQGIQFDDLLFTQEYYNQYIIDVSATVIRDMFEKTVAALDET